MRILVTGTSGLLGYSLLQTFKNKHEIWAFTRHPVSDPHVHSIVGDLSTAATYANLPNEVDVIIHMAQSNDYRHFPDKAVSIFEVNCAATAHLLDYAMKAKVKHFIFTSTGSVYEPYQNKMLEGDPVNPGSYYATSKYIAERLIHTYQAYFKTTILRLFFLYGPHPSPKQTLINGLIQRIERGEAISVDGTKGGLTFVPTLTHDVSRCIDAVIDTSLEGIFNVANPEFITLLDVANIIAIRLDKKLNISRDESKTPMTIVPSVDKITRALPGLRFTPFTEGINALHCA